MRHYKCDKCYDTGKMRGDVDCDAESCELNKKLQVTYKNNGREALESLCNALRDSRWFS